MRNFPVPWKRDLTNAESEAIVFRLGLMGRELQWALMKADAFVTAVKDVREQESIRTRLSALMALCVESQYGSPLRVNNRLILATALQPSSKPELKDRPVLLEGLGGSFRLSEAEAVAQGIPIGFPRLLSRRKVLELKLLILVSEWAENEGRLERGWSSDPDLHIELGLRSGPRRKSKDGRKLEDLVQYRVDKTSDEKRILWIHKMESERTERVIPTPIYSTMVVERGADRYYVSTGIKTRIVSEWETERSLTGEFIGFENRASGRDEQDVDRESDYGTLHEHEGYAGVKPRRAPTRDENALSVREHYRIDDSEIWLCRFTDGYERLQKTLVNKKGEPFEVDWKLRSSFVPKGSEKPIKFWEKRFFPGDLISLAHPKLGAVSKDAEVNRIMKDPNVRGECKLAWKKGGFDPFSDRTLPHEDVGLLGNEVICMLRGAIEEKAFDHIAIVPTKDYEKVLFDKKSGRWVSGLQSPCFRCTKKWGVEDVRRWKKMAHAWVCPVCGSERARVYGRVWAKVGLLGMLPIEDRLQKVTHVEFAVYGQWLGELIHRGVKVDGLPRLNREHVHPYTKRVALNA